MTNFEFYKDEIFRCLGEYGCGVAIRNNKPERCDGRCNSCIRHSAINECIDKSLFQWLYAEHTEHIELTKRERAFCEAVQTGWIARNGDDELFWFRDCPEKYTEENRKNWVCTGVPLTWNRINKAWCDFDFIQWTDEKPWAVEDLLKLEVQEDG